jgi:uncharacterized protein YkwD
MTRTPGIASASLTLALFALLAVLTAPAVAGGEEARALDSDRGPAVSAGGGYATALLRHHNAERSRRGVRRLKSNRYLRRAARAHARDMVRSHYFGHVSRSGRDVVDRVRSTPYGRSGFAVQENLYWWSPKRSPVAVVRAWMRSAVHRANVIDRRWRQFGAAAVMRTPFGRRGVTVVAVYGTRTR